MRILICAIIFVSLVSCTYNKGELIPVITNPTTDSCTENISFDEDIQPIFNTKCATSNCHDGTRPEVFTNYAGILALIDTVNVDDSRIKIRINDINNPMPPAGSPTLSSCELSKINSWINAKAPNN